MPAKTLAGIAVAGAMVGGGSIVANNAINPYTDVGNAYVLPITDSLNSDATSSITVASDAPDITLSKWGGQAQMTVAYDAPAPTSDASRPFLSKSLDYSDTSDQSITMNPVDATTTMEDGGMEVDINLASEPDTNVFNFDISGSDDMDFYYQPPLSQDDPQAGWTCTDTECDDAQGNPVEERPENIVGSYAVYSADRANDEVGGTNYATGKLFQIFRPLVTDSMGSTTWATLSYQDGVLSVTVPQDFLDNASYPVVVDPTFGYTTVGGTATGFSNQINGNVTDVLSTSGTITSMSMYVGGSSGSEGEAAIYTSSGSALLGNTSQSTWSSAGWQTANLISSYSASAGTYALVSWRGTTGSVTIYGDNTGSASAINMTSVTYTGSWPSTLTVGTAAYTYSIYATYTAGGGSSPTINPYDTVLFQ